MKKRKNKIAKIYLITNTVNNKKYIGATITSVKSRWNRHISESKRETDGQVLHRAIRKYGKDVFTVEEIYRSNDVEYVFNIKENECILEYKSHGTQHGYNMTWGGEGWNGMKHTKKTKKLLSKIHTGKKLSEGHKKKIGESLRDRYATFPKSKMSNATKKKISKSKTGVKHTPEAKKNMSLSKFGHKHSEQTKKRQSESAEKYEYTLIDPSGNKHITRNLSKFCVEHNLSDQNLGKVIRGLPGFNSHKGWKGKRKPL